MDIKEIKDAIQTAKNDVNEVVEIAKKEAKEAGEMSAKTQKTVDSLMDNIKSLESKLEDSVDKDTVKKLQDHLDILDMKLQHGSASKGNVSFRESLKAALAENLSKLKNMSVNAESQAKALDNAFSFKVDGNVNLTQKAVGNMTTTGNVTGELPQAMLVPGLNTIASRSPRLLEIANMGSISSNLVKWAYQSGKEGSAGQTAEGAAKNQIDFDILLGQASVVKTTAFIKVSDEMIEDVDFIESEIQNELLRELLKAVEAGVYGGAGSGNALAGFRTQATAFQAGDFAAAIDNANIVDVLTVAVNQVDISEQGEVSHILMNPSDLAQLKLIKVTATDNRYVDRLVTVGGSMTLDGIPIIKTTLVAKGEYLLGDFSRAFVLQRSGVNIEVGLDSDDFTKNLRTIRAEWRGVSYIKHNDRTAFVKGVFATDAAALETI